MAEKTDKSAPTSVHRTERVLIFMIAAIVVLSIVAFVVRLMGSVAGVSDYTTGIWPAVSVLPLIGLPLAMLLIIAYVVASGARRVRENRGTTR
ncbi:MULTISPECIES: multidrug ABC transporter ATPase [unclassified Frigoribacterium]|uniref:multidrug ABC transporter ATPase n=1 Tax=unclassified Frigoribacterium TaxID=2627005 RepID=UPI0012E137CD|nr:MULTISPECIES: multidrug ABC transporter ATPase [unclassified Frigoribacterium]